MDTKPSTLSRRKPSNGTAGAKYALTYGKRKTPSDDAWPVPATCPEIANPLIVKLRLFWPASDRPVRYTPDMREPFICIGIQALQNQTHKKISILPQESDTTLNNRMWLLRLMSPVTNIQVGDYVEIMLSSDHTRTSSDVVWHIFPPSGNDWTTVLLENGDRGRVIQVINSEELIMQRIMREDQHTENKENFSEYVMRHKVIPQTVQSFLNSEGGYLYIGVHDTGTLEERLVGLDYDFGQIEDHESMTDDKLCDTLKRNIMNALGKYLESDTDLGPLVDIRFVQVSGTHIVEIKILQSPKPWFFRHLTKGNRPQVFNIQHSDKKVEQRELDDFYIRRGDSKKMLSTHKEFYKYAVDHFKT